MNPTQPHENLSPEDIMRICIQGVRLLHAGQNPDKALKKFRKHLGDSANNLGVKPAEVRQLFDKILNEKEQKMTIYDFADEINKELVWTRYPNQKGRVSVFFKESSVDVPEGFLGQFGNGHTPEEALDFTGFFIKTQKTLCLSHLLFLNGVPIFLLKNH